MGRKGSPKSRSCGPRGALTSLTLSLGRRGMVRGGTSAEWRVSRGERTRSFQSGLLDAVCRVL